MYAVDVFDLIVNPPLFVFLFCFFSFNARASALRPEEQVLWNSSALPELMSDEEDGFRNGEPVWIVSAPPGTSPELSFLCQQLQERK